MHMLYHHIFSGCCMCTVPGGTRQEVSLDSTVPCSSLNTIASNSWSTWSVNCSNPLLQMLVLNISSPLPSWIGASWNLTIRQIQYDHTWWNFSSDLGLLRWYVLTSYVPLIQTNKHFSFIVTVGNTLNVTAVKLDAEVAGFTGAI